MMLARVCRATISPQITSLLKAPIVPRVIKYQPKRHYASRRQQTYARSALRERFAEPAGETAFTIGKGFAAGGAVIGLGALCYYGAGLSSATGAIDHAALWPEYVKERIRTTYMYFGGSIAISTATAAAIFRSPSIMRFVSSGGIIGCFIAMAAAYGASALAQSIPYQEGFGAKQMAWMLHAGVIGAIIAPLSLYGGTIILTAAMYTAGIIGGLSAVAACAPSDKFLNIGGALGIGFGVVLASSVGSMFLPPTTVLGAGLYSVALYGGLVLFSLFLLYDTQRVIRDAETYPVVYRKFNIQGNAVRPFDPVNHAMHIYVAAVNIFVRIVQMVYLSGSGKRS